MIKLVLLKHIYCHNLWCAGWKMGLLLNAVPRYVPYILTYKTQFFLTNNPPPRVEPHIRCTKISNIDQNIHHHSLHWTSVVYVRVSSYMSSESVSDLSDCSTHNISPSVPYKSLLIEHFLNDLVMLCIHFCNTVWSSLLLVPMC